MKLVLSALLSSKRKQSELCHNNQTTLHTRRMRLPPTLAPQAIE